MNINVRELLNNKTESVAKEAREDATSETMRRKFQVPTELELSRMTTD